MPAIVPMTQQEYVTYSRCLSDINSLESEQALKFITENISLFDKEPDLSNQTFQIIVELKNRISYINAVHHKLQQGELNQREFGDCTPLAAELYNRYLKIISIWNQTFAQNKLNITYISSSPNGLLDVTLSNQTPKQIADEKALKRYSELIPPRSGDLNDHTQGAYEVFYDPQAIDSVYQQVFERLYLKGLQQGLSDSEASQLAANNSRPGVVYEDQYWVWVRDAVISPVDHCHTYNRIIWKEDLKKSSGVAILPVIVSDNEIKVVLILVYRHATETWELEIPRGRAKADEPILQTAYRKTEQETGFTIDECHELGTMAVDSGLTSSKVPVYLGVVSGETKTEHDNTEAIQARYTFPLPEILAGLEKGTIELEINGKKTDVYVRDPFLTYGLLIAQQKQLL